MHPISIGDESFVLALLANLDLSLLGVKKTDSFDAVGFFVFSPIKSDTQSNGCLQIVLQKFPLSLLHRPVLPWICDTVTLARIELQAVVFVCFC